jgi:hypothetical protein
VSDDTGKPQGGKRTYTYQHYKENKIPPFRCIPIRRPSLLKRVVNNDEGANFVTGLQPHDVDDVEAVDVVLALASPHGVHVNPAAPAL